MRNTILQKCTILTDNILDILSQLAKYKEIKHLEGRLSIYPKVFGKIKYFIATIIDFDLPLLFVFEIHLFLIRTNIYRNNYSYFTYNAEYSGNVDIDFRFAGTQCC